MTIAISGPAKISLAYNSDGTPVKPYPQLIAYALEDSGKPVVGSVSWSRTVKSGYINAFPTYSTTALTQLDIKSVDSFKKAGAVVQIILNASYKGIKYTLPIEIDRVEAGAPAPVLTPTPTPSPTPTPTPTPTPSPAPAPVPSGDWRSILLSTGKAPKNVMFDGVSSQVDTLQTSYAGYEYPCQISADGRHVRFETRPDDPGSSKRRAEFHYPARRVPNDTVLWFAYSFISEPWSAKLSSGGCEFQQHWDGDGSPGLAIRRGQDGSWQVTTRGDGQTNTKRYTGTCSFGEVHDVVARCIFGANGVLDLWLDGKQLITDLHVPMGGAAMPNGGTYPCFGVYYAGGVKCPVAAQYANVVLPSTASLADRVSSPPAW